MTEQGLNHEKDKGQERLAQRIDQIGDQTQTVKNEIQVIWSIDEKIKDTYVFIRESWKEFERDKDISDLDYDSLEEQERGIISKEQLELLISLDDLEELNISQYRNKLRDELPSLAKKKWQNELWLYRKELSAMCIADINKHLYTRLEQTPDPSEQHSSGFMPDERIKIYYDAYLGTSKNLITEWSESLARDPIKKAKRVLTSIQNFGEAHFNLSKAESGTEGIISSGIGTALIEGLCFCDIAIQLDQEILHQDISREEKIERYTELLTQSWNTLDEITKLAINPGVRFMKYLKTDIGGAERNIYNKQRFTLLEEGKDRIISFSPECEGEKKRLVQEHREKRKNGEWPPATTCHARSAGPEGLTQYKTFVLEHLAPRLLGNLLDFYDSDYGRSYISSFPE